MVLGKHVSDSVVVEIKNQTHFLFRPIIFLISAYKFAEYLIINGSCLASFLIVYL